MFITYKKRPTNERQRMKNDLSTNAQCAVRTLHANSKRIRTIQLPYSYINETSNLQFFPLFSQLVLAVLSLSRSILSNPITYMHKYMYKMAVDIGFTNTTVELTNCCRTADEQNVRIEFNNGSLTFYQHTNRLRCF